MGKAKLRLELIENEKARRKTFEIRKNGMKKKAEQLSKLCEVNLCMVLCPPAAATNEKIEPFIWSNDPSQVADLVGSYKQARASNHECKNSRTYDLVSFFMEQTAKVRKEIEKVKKANRLVKYPNWDEKYDSLSEDELKSFAAELSAKADAAKQRIGYLKERGILDVLESSFSVDPRIQEHPAFDASGVFGANPQAMYFNAQSYVEDQQRMMMMMMLMNNSNNHGASWAINDAWNYNDLNVINSDPLTMHYDAVNYSDRNVINFHPLMSNNGLYYNMGS